MSDIEIDAGEIDAYAARLAAVHGVVAGETQKMVQRIVVAGQGFAREATPVDTGVLRNAWATEATATGGKIGNATQYARVVDEGRRPGAAMPPAGALLPWMSRHGIPAEAEFVVRRGIARRGIPAKRMIEQTKARLPPTIEAALSELARAIVARLRV